MTKQSISDLTRFNSKLRPLGFVMALLAPLALFGFLASPNEYPASGIEGAVDCEGPLNVFIFAVPALLGYASCFIIGTRLALETRRVGLVLVAAIAGVICLGLAANAALATKEYFGFDYQQSCDARL